MATSDEILAKLEEIKGIVANLNDDGTVPGKVVKVVNGLSEIDGNLGLVSAGEFRAGNREVPGQGFSGVRIAYPAMVYDGEDWHVVGINDDSLQFGLRASDGAALFGGGNSILDQDGLAVDDGSSNNAIRVFSQAATYNGESMGAGDVLIGDNSSGQANLLWDASEGSLKLRHGTTVTAEISSNQAFGNVGVRVVRSTNQSISDASYTKIDFASETYDDADFWESGSSDEITIPQTGVYRVECNIEWADDATGRRELIINPPAVGDNIRVSQNAAVDGGTWQSTSGEFEADENDTVIVQVWQNSGGSINLARSVLTIRRVR